MADYFAGRIEIGGPLSRKVFEDLSAAILNEGWLSLIGYGDEPATEETLRKAFQAGQTVTLFDEQALYGQFDELEEFLVKHRIHFDRLSEARYEYNAELVRYRGRGRPAVCPSNTDGECLIRAADVAVILARRGTAACRLRAIRKLVTAPASGALAPLHWVGEPSTARQD